METNTRTTKTNQNKNKVSKMENKSNQSTMKNYRLKALFFAAIIALTATSCQKDEETDPVATRPDSFSELKVDNTFDWSTANNYTIHYKGTPVGMEVKKPLEIKTQDGQVIRKVNIALSDNAVIDVRVPSKNETLIISWGTHEKALVLGASTTVDFTFVEPDTEEL
jgi:hypothetical protein